MTYVIPAGQFDRVEDPATGRNLVVADSFKLVEQSPVTPFSMFMSIM